ncbi:hypothetical protein P5V15_014400 [Pogonomyrmex californicus]
MKILCFIMMGILQLVIAGIVRKPPVFSTPMYSNSYLPAAMQVIFHAVEQLKLLQVEETQVDLMSSSTSIKHFQQLQPTTQSMKDQKLQSTTPKGISIISNVTTEKVHDEKTEASEILISTLSSEILNQGPPKIYNNSTEVIQHLATNSDYKETPEVNEEMTETNYELPATPEMNYELPEHMHVIQESDQKVLGQNEEKSSSIESSSEIVKIQTPQYTVLEQQSTQTFLTQTSEGQKKEEPNVDSVVDEIYGIIKTTTSLFSEEPSDSKTKSTLEISIEKMENIEDEREETRFSLLGEKVAQVPRPSLNSYIRRIKVPARPALQQLANLYDALSKDARKQGFARFAGYSDEVLKALQSSAEGGIGPQLKKLLEKVLERNELTRDDAKMRTSQALRDLDDPASALSKDLRRLLPLRYTF